MSIAARREHDGRWMGNGNFAIEEGYCTCKEGMAAAKGRPIPQDALIEREKKLKQRHDRENKKKTKLRIYIPHSLRNIDGRGWHHPLITLGL